MATEVLAPITGTVWKIEKRPGDSVAEGEAIVILESMKMEVPVEAPRAGKVASVLVKETEPVEEGALVATLE